MIFRLQISQFDSLRLLNYVRMQNLSPDTCLDQHQSLNSIAVILLLLNPILDLNALDTKKRYFSFNF